MMKRATRLAYLAFASIAAAAFLAPTAQPRAEEITDGATAYGIAVGGKLYDRWYKVTGAEKPTTAHALYPTDKAYADKPADNWRCKECHGWDTMGVDGAYKSGKHSSGIKGINAMRGADPDKVVALLKASAHGFGDKMSDAELNYIALFVSKGQVDMDQYIDRATKAPKGDAGKGAVYYNTMCVNCHGMDGKLPKEMPPLGSLMGNPWEIMHKVLYGQPGEAMPALIGLDHQITTDILAHLTTLPKE